MGRLQLQGGSYSARSPIANAQRCVNYYPEANRRDSPVPFTYYQRPGLRAKVTGPNAPVRGLYRASNGAGYCVIGQHVFAVAPNWQLEELGQLVTPRMNPVSFIDNGIDIMLVDGSAFGYTINLASNVFAQITDITGTFTGATRVDTIDTFVIWNYPGTNIFGSTLSNSISFDSLYIAGKSAYPDKLATLIVNRHEIVLLGTLKSEIWYDAGNPQFPFAELPGAYVEHGIVAPYSVAAQDIEVYWLGQDLQSNGVVFALKGYDTRRISNHALEEAITKLKANGGNILDAIGYTYQLGGHVFYVLIFPSAPNGGQTWVYDAALGDDPTMAWHQECWTDPDGNLLRHRANCYAYINGVNVVGDWENGTLYALDPGYYTDDCGAALSGPISYIKGFPHIVEAWNASIGQPSLADGKMVKFKNFTADIEVGNGPLDANGAASKVWLKWSDDKGVSFGTAVLQSDGAPGEFKTEPKWGGAGMARDRVFELSHSIAGPCALNGGWVEAEVMNN